MNKHDTKTYNDLEHNEKIPARGCDVKYVIDEVKESLAKDCSGSQELFSDDDQVRDTNFDSPKVETKNDTCNSSIIIKTPILFSKLAEETPGKAVVPNTPINLLPFITKTSLLWTSDMETPRSKPNARPLNYNETINSDSNCSPCHESMKSSEAKITSPVLGGKKRSKRRVKKRLVNIEFDNNSENQTTNSSNSDKVSSKVVNSPSNEFASDNDYEIKKPCTEESKNGTSEEYKENNKLVEATVVDKNSNTSTQDFFSNASFTAIDHLCCSTIKEEPTSSIPKLNELKYINSDKVIKEEIISKKEQINIINISKDVLEKVAAIKRIQKPIRRSTDISHTEIPKEVFSRSLIELELADHIQASQKNEKGSEILNKPLNFMSVTKLSSINQKLRENNINYPAQEVSNDITSGCVLSCESYKENLKIDFNSNNSDNKKLLENIRKKDHDNCINQNKEIKNQTYSTNSPRKMEIESKEILFKQITNQTKSNNSCSNKDNLRSKNFYLSNTLSELDGIIEKPIGICIEGNKHMAANEDKLLDNLKVKIKSEDLNGNSNHVLKKSNIAEKVELNFRNTNILDTDQSNNTNKFIKNNLTNSNLKIEKSHLSQELNTKEKSKFMYESKEFCTDSFTTARGNGIKINSEKETYYLKIYNELDDVNIEKKLMDIKKSKIVDNTLSTNNSMRGKSLTIFNKKERSIKNNILANSVIPKLEKDVVIDNDKNLKENIKKENDNIICNNDLNGSNIKTEIIPEIKTSDQHTCISENGFSTARGKNIKINEDKERHYTEIFHKLNEDIHNENDFHKLSKAINRKSLKIKNLPASNQTQIQNKKVEAKLSISSDTDEAFYNLGDVEELLTPGQNDSMNNKIMNDNNCFTIPTSACVLKIKKEIVKDTVNEKYKILANKKQFVEIKRDTDNEILEQNYKYNHDQDLKYMGLMKRKLDNCDVKRTERCRSFGGFSENSGNISVIKLNKSDPLNESLGNQPLKKDLSVSQCFDSHSDSIFFEVDITSCLNNHQAKLLDVQPQNKKMKIEKDVKNFEKSVNLLGFSFKECTESFRLYSHFRKFFEKPNLIYCGAELSIESGQSISISNQTSIKQRIYIQCKPNLNFTNNVNEENYILTENIPKKIIPKVFKKNQGDTKGLKKIDGHVVEKRKHTDTDSDTPLSTLKKPRISSEFQGRKLFSDESSDDKKGKLKSENQKNVSQNKSPEPILISVEMTAQLEKDLSNERLMAILNQEKIIRNKKRLKIRPMIGSLLHQRLENSNSRISWVDLVGNEVPRLPSLEEIKENHPDAGILEITSSNATCYKFLSSNIIGNKKVVSLNTEDGGQLIFDENGHLSVNEFKEAFLAMPGVDPKLIPNGWIENHYKWIIWKLACIDRIRFNSTQLPKMLTPERVMKELKYRYDREIDRAERPALRKILEKDDVSSRRMVLCISSISENAHNNEIQKEARILLGIPRWRIEATDGWYSIPLTIDNAMTNLISTCKIKEGTKLITYGAELLNCERGFYPLEIPPNVSLKIYSNCTRRAKWDTKLGYQKSSRPIPIKLRNILVNGGMIGETTAVAARVYPLLFREKTQDGQSIYRNARSEEKAAIAHERSLELKLDAMYAEAQKNFDSKGQADFNEDFQTSEMSTKANKHNHWESKREEFKQRLECEVRQNLPPPRQVTPVLKVRLVDDRATVILTIWGANEDSAFDIKEGDTITIYNCFAMGTRDGELNLTANRGTHIKTEQLLKLPHPYRICTVIPDIKGGGVFSPKFDEFDTVGLVVSLGAAPYGMKNFDMVIIAWPKSENSRSYLSILFWRGVASYGYQGMFPIGSFIACSNLQWRKSISWSIAVAYSTEKTVFTSNPRQPHLAKELNNIKALVENPLSYAEICAEEVSNELLRKPRSNQGTPTNFLDKTSFSNVSIASPMENYSPSNPTIQKRMEKLSRYGTGALDISPGVLNNSSVHVTKCFTPVTRRAK